MFNFLHHKLLPKVSCKCPATENHEATNLISSNFFDKSNGFLAYTIIKPPIELEFELICPVSISYISLLTTVGAQKCSGIELFAKNVYNRYISIGRAVYSQNGVVFCDSNVYSKANRPPRFRDDFCLCFFKRDTLRILKDTTVIKVVIFRTEKSVPCLGSVEIVGKPGQSCSATTKDTIERLMTDPVVSNKPEKDSKIPEEFKDDLTFELMKTPMTLPSGKTVDCNTLKKHNENEASFGRRPCDPFTGLPLISGRKAVLNVALKSRIDMFLLENQDFYVEQTRTGNVEENCCCCSMSSTLYVTPCSHFYCKQCLLGLTVWKCTVCGVEFCKNDVVKYNKR